MCGENEIRTRDTLEEYTRFPGVPLQPLEHLSFFRSAKVEEVFETNKYLERIMFQNYLLKNTDFHKTSISRTHV